MQKTLLDLLITGTLFLFVTVLGVVAFGFMVAGVHLLLMTHVPAWSAALLTGCAVLLLAILVLLVFRLAKGSGSRSRSEERGDGERRGARSRDRDDARQDGTRNAELIELAMELAGKSNLNARDATLIALIAGTVVGVSPGLRAQIMALFAEAPVPKEDDAR